jgi:hypothetical protein
MTQSPYLVKKRILEGNKLWGAVVENQSKLFKMDIQDLLGLISYYKRTVLVDIPNADKPATLVVVNHMIKDGLAFYFRTVHDKLKGNNFNKVPAIKLITANKLKVLKP